MSKIILEAPVFTIEAALVAAESGVDRLELCADFEAGGTTPSAGTLAFLKEKIDIPVFVMIRPRHGDFVYGKEELYVMKKDIRILKKIGADGFVFGALKTNGTVDVSACKYLIQETGGLPCTFHRAFDLVADQETALKTIIELGFHRILTSGGKNTVQEGLAAIEHLINLSADRLIIMPGGGLKPEHVEILKKTGNLKEVHASCKKVRPSEFQSSDHEVSFSSNPDLKHGVLTVDPEMVAKFKSVM